MFIVDIVGNEFEFECNGVTGSAFNLYSSRRGD